MGNNFGTWPTLLAVHGRFGMWLANLLVPLNIFIWDNLYVNTCAKDALIKIIRKEEECWSSS